MASWENLLRGIKDDVAAELNNEISSLLSSAKSDANDIVKAHGLQVENYMKQLAAGEITKARFDGYMRDEVRLLGMEKAEMQVEAKASAQRLITGIEKHILDQLLKLL